MIEILDGFADNVIAVECSGHVTKADYDTVLVPAVRKALDRQDKIRLYYQVATDFEGVDPGAMWEDFRIGVEHLTRWERMAVVTDVDWIRHTIKAFSFLMPGELRVFATSEATQARQWVSEASPA